MTHHSHPKKEKLTIQMTVEMDIPEKFLPLDESSVDLQKLFVLFHAGRTKIKEFKVIK